MAYKDKDRQREANAERQRRYKAKQKALLNEGVTGVIPKGVTEMIQDVAANGGEYSFKTVKGEVQDVHHTQHKRGKDIKCFADLPPDVQQTIDSLSIVEGKIDKTIKANRTTIAIGFQRQFGNYNSKDIL
jgi:hypothetical protein